MSKDQPSSPVATLRQLALSLERLVAHEAAKGVVRGTADGLRKELPGLHADALARRAVQPPAGRDHRLHALAHG
ncbi:hypothetical protein ACN28S_26130 [Cystobacter fuscus]